MDIPAGLNRVSVADTANPPNKMLMLILMLNPNFIYHHHSEERSARIVSSRTTNKCPTGNQSSIHIFSLMKLCSRKSVNFARGFSDGWDWAECRLGGGGVRCARGSAGMIFMIGRRRDAMFLFVYVDM